MFLRNKIGKNLSKTSSNTDPCFGGQKVLQASRKFFTEEVYPGDARLRFWFLQTTVRQMSDLGQKSDIVSTFCCHAKA